MGDGVLEQHSVVYHTWITDFYKFCFDKVDHREDYRLNKRRFQAWLCHPPVSFSAWAALVRAYVDPSLRVLSNFFPAAFHSEFNLLRFCLASSSKISFSMCREGCC